MGLAPLLAAMLYCTTRWGPEEDRGETGHHACADVILHVLAHRLSAHLVNPDFRIQIPTAKTGDTGLNQAPGRTDWADDSP